MFVAISASLAARHSAGRLQPDALRPGDAASIASTCCCRTAVSSSKKGSSEAPRSCPAGYTLTNRKPKVLREARPAGAWPSARRWRSACSTKASSRSAPCRCCRTIACSARSTPGATRDTAFTDDDVELLGQVAQQVAIAVENALAFQRDRRAQGQAGQGKALPGGGDPHEHNFGEIVGESARARGC